jgi:hypothetical protein
MSSIKFNVLNRWSGNIQFTAEIECDENSSPRIKMGLAVKWACLRDADLRGADLRGADLSGAVLRDAVLLGADLRGADLSGAVLRDAVLRGADLLGADLRGADLSGAVLRDAVLLGADLRGADLRGAVLRGADLSDSDLRDAVLRGADLSDSDLSDAVLRSFKADMWMTLTENPGEVPALIRSLREGKIDGSQYEGECACLVGTIANAKGVPHYDLTHNQNNPAERWFMMIHKGDKPGDDTGGGFASKMALEWAEEFCRLHNISTEIESPTREMI